MKLIIDIPEEVKQTFDNAKNEDLYGNYYDYNSLIGKAIQNGTPLPKGHWIIMGDRYIKCSECGHITKTESPDIYNFCMVCGANMSENPTSSKPEISSYYGLKSYVRERSEE